MAEFRTQRLAFRQRMIEWLAHTVVFSMSQCPQTVFIINHPPDDSSGLYLQPLQIIITANYLSRPIHIFDLHFDTATHLET